ncbi:MAG TPA: hypothetical protein VNI77_10495 [Nitrososphaera sp.]|nr:hypothetical protein [Nitrososphaera sp.]
MKRIGPSIKVGGEHTKAVAIDTVKGSTIRNVILATGRSSRVPPEQSRVFKTWIARYHQIFNDED